MSDERKWLEGGTEEEWLEGLNEWLLNPDAVPVLTFKPLEEPKP